MRSRSIFLRARSTSSHFVNEDSSVGVKMQGGRVSHQANEIEIRCLPGDLPEYIEVDMAEVEIGQVIHLSDVTLPEGVVSVALALGEEHDLAIANISAPKAVSETDDDSVASDEEDAAADAGNDVESKDLSLIHI